jgi:hypothetical protein
MSRPSRAVVSALAVLILLSVPVTAQRTVPRTFYVSASDETGAPVLNLTAADFLVTENGVKREVSRAALGNTPLRIVLMVDSSTPVGPMMNTFRAALTGFVDALPESEEIVFISSGGQIRIRSQAADTRDKLRAEIARFASDGGANAFLDTLLEADKRFLKPVPAQWPAFVIITTDNGDSMREPNVDDYNKFMQDFLARGGAAHAVIVQGKRSGSTTDLVANLVDNMGGLRTTINTETSLPARLKDIANRLADDHQRMMTRYQISYAGDTKVMQPTINVGSSRDGVQLQMSVRRPF